MLHWNHLILAFPKIQKSCKNNMWELYDLVFSQVCPTSLDDLLIFLPNPAFFSGNHLTDPADHPHSPLYLRWRCGALDTEPQQRAATWLWHRWQTCLFRQRFLPTLTTVLRHIHEETQTVRTQLFIFFDTEAFPVMLQGRISVKQSWNVFSLTVQIFLYVKFNCC